MKNVPVVAKTALLIFLYYIVYYLYIGFLHPIPAPGDSWDYHIPISLSILSGSFIHLQDVRTGQWYYPGSSEAFNSLLLFLHIPLTISNIFPIIILLFALWKLGTIFKLRYYSALLFATTFCSLTAVVRWMNAVSIDMWVAVFFVFSIILLEKPEKSLKYFALLGFTLGMLIGSKYLAIWYVLLLIVLYGKSVVKIITIFRLIVFFIPFTIFGLFWYIRNYMLTGNPFYPLQVFGLKGVPLFSETVLQASLLHPFTMLDAFFSEYKLWILIVPIAVYWLLRKYVGKNKEVFGVRRLFIIGLINFVLYTQFPTSNQPWIMVSSLRYSFPTFIPLILGVFILAESNKKTEVLGYIAIATMLPTLSIMYYPKLLLVYLPLALLAFYAIDKRKLFKEIK